MVEVGSRRMPRRRTKPPSRTLRSLPSVSQVRFSSRTSSSCLAAACRSSSWKWRWASTPLKGASPAGPSSAPSSPVSPAHWRSVARQPHGGPKATSAAAAAAACFAPRPCFSQAAALTGPPPAQNRPKRTRQSFHFFRFKGLSDSLASALIYFLFPAVSLLPPKSQAFALTVTIRRKTPLKKLQICT